MQYHESWWEGRCTVEGRRTSRARVDIIATSKKEKLARRGDTSKVPPKYLQRQLLRYRRDAKGKMQNAKRKMQDVKHDRGKSRIEVAASLSSLKWTSVIHGSTFMIHWVCSRRVISHRSSRPVCPSRLVCIEISNHIVPNILEHPNHSTNSRRKPAEGLRRSKTKKKKEKKKKGIDGPCLARPRNPVRLTSEGFGFPRGPNPSLIQQFSSHV